MRHIAAATLLAMTLLTQHARAANFPGVDWEPAPKPTGTCAAALDRLPAELGKLPSTALMVVAGGQELYRWGDVAEISYLASARKSILSMLYGRQVADGTIKLDATVGELGLDDVGGLLPIEKTATVRDLLTARSGVYHEAGSPGSDLSDVPARGSKPPGSYWMYNNWDFNVAGAVYAARTGHSVFEGFAQDLAGPLHLQDYDPARQHMLGDPASSRFLAYHFFLSGRDMARLGLLMVRGGTWQGQQIIPADWVRQSTTLRVPVAELHGGAHNGTLGYGYLWWIPVGRPGPEWQGAFLANGNYGQFILGLPALDMVIVHRRAVTDEFAIARNLGKDNSNPPGVTAEQFMKLIEPVVTAQCAKPAN